MELTAMVGGLNVFYIIQGVNTLLAIGFNLFLVYLATVVVKNRSGSYQIIVIVYAVFEALYAVVTFVGMPVHFVSKGTWVVFNNLGLLAGTKFSWLGPSLFCIFYQIWIILIVSHFVCRYICVCRPHLASSIKDSSGKKRMILFFLTFMSLFALTCGIFFCTRLPIADQEFHSVLNDYNLPNATDLNSFGYILLRPKELDGTISLIGLTTILNHFALVSTSFLIISFCTIFVWLEVRKIKLIGSIRRKKEAATQSKILFSLLVQTSVPFIFCHIPSVIFLSIPFLNTDFSFGQYSLIFTWTTTAVKFIDPLIVMALVPDYRRAVLKVFGFSKYEESVSSVMPAGSYHSSHKNGRATATAPTSSIQDN